MSRVSCLPFLTALGLLAACHADDLLSNRAGPTSITSLPRALTSAETQIVAADNGFAFSLFREIARRANPDSNLFISPLSASMALGMAYNGAGGTTQTEMQQTLGLQGVTLDDVDRSYQSLIALLRGLDRHVTFTLGNSVWYDAAFTPLPAFLNATRTYFDATVQSLDFASATAAATINQWVSAHTGGKIPSIVPNPIPDSVVMYLLNAIYFKGDWANRFDQSRTRPAPFTLRTGDQTSVATMSLGRSTKLGYLADGNVTVVDLPYGGRAFSMTILLPSHPAAIDSLVPTLTGGRWNGWMAGLDSTTVQDVFLPKFTLVFGLKLNDVLSALGMPSAFCGGPADFTRLANVAVGELCLSEVRHKAFVSVDEQGTEAAAATSDEFFDVCFSCGPPTVVINRPFVFVIRERFSGTILFMGRVMSPAAPS